MAISLRINEDDKMLFKRYVKMKEITLLELGKLDVSNPNLLGDNTYVTKK